MVGYYSSSTSSSNLLLLINQKKTRVCMHFKFLKFFLKCSAIVEWICLSFLFWPFIGGSLLVNKYEVAR